MNECRQQRQSTRPLAQRAGATERRSSTKSGSSVKQQTRSPSDKFLPTQTNDWTDKRRDSFGILLLHFVQTMQTLCPPALPKASKVIRERGKALFSRARQLGGVRVGPVLVLSARALGNGPVMQYSWWQLESAANSLMARFRCKSRSFVRSLALYLSIDGDKFLRRCQARRRENDLLKFV